MKTSNKQNKKPQTSGLLWDRDFRLEFAKQVKYSDDNWLNKVETDFVEASMTQRRRNIARLVIGVSLAFIGVSGFAAFLWYQLQLSQLREKSARVENLLQTDPVEGLVLAIQTIGQNRSTPIVNRNILPEVESSLFTAVQTAKERDRYKQNSEINAVAFSPDSQKIISAGFYRDVDGNGGGKGCLWNLHNNLNPIKLEGELPIIQAIAFSQDGKTIIGSAPGITETTSDMVQFWDSQGNPIPLPFQEEHSPITSAVFSLNGETIVSGHIDGSVSLWNKQGSRIWQTSEKHANTTRIEEVVKDSGKVDRVTFSPDGKTIFSHGNDGIRMWNLLGEAIGFFPNEVTNYYGHLFAESQEEFTPNSVSAGFECNSEKETISTQLNLLSKSFSFSGDSQYMLYSDGFGASLNTISKQTSFDINSPAALSPNGKTFISAGKGDMDTTIMLHDSRPTYSDYGISSDCEVDSTDNATCEFKQIGPSFLGHPDTINAIAFSPDGSKFVTGGKKGHVRVWDVQGINLLKQLNLKNCNVEYSCLRIAVNPNGQLIATGDENGRISLLDGKSNPTQPPIETGEPINIGFPDFLLSHSGNEIIANTTEGLYKWDFQGNKIPIKTNNSNQWTNLLAWSPDGQQIISRKGSFDDFNPTDQNSLCLWRIQEGSLIPTILPTGQGEDSNCQEVDSHIAAAAFSPNGETVAFSTLRGTVNLWDLKSNQIGQPLQAPNVTSIAFSQDGITVASRSSGGIIRLSNLQGGLIGSLRGEADKNPSVQSSGNLVFGPDSNTLITTNDVGVIQHWAIGSEQLLQVACNRLQNHPVLKNPTTNEGKAAKATCEKYVWHLPQPFGQNENISSGDKILVPTLTSFDKQAGVEAIKNGDFAAAIQHLEAHLETTPNDPEALIYLNNARIGTQAAHTLAISAPISTDVNGALEMLRGVAQAQQETNVASGINQVPLRMLIADDDNAPDTAQQIAETLVKNPDVMGVVGHYASDVTLATGKIYQAGKLVAISPVSTSVKLTGFGDFIFRTVPNDAVAAKALADYMRSQLNLRNAAIFYNSKSGYSTSLKSEFIKFLNKQGGQVANPLVFDLSDPNFDAEQTVEQSIANGAEVLVLLPNSGELNDTLQVVQANNQRLPLLSGDDVYTPETLKTGAVNAEGMVVAVPWHILAADPTFRETSRALWRADVNWRTAMSYDATLALITGLQQNPSREGLAEILRSPSVVAQGATGPIQFDSLGDRDSKIQLVEIENTGATSRSGFGYDFVPVVK